MTYVTYGYGIDDNNFGGVAAYGLGLDPTGVVFAALNLGLNLDIEAQSFLLEFGFEPDNIYAIAEDPRYLPIYEEARECIVDMEKRTITIIFDDRSFIVIDLD